MGSCYTIADGKGAENLEGSVISVVEYSPFANEPILLRLDRVRSAGGWVTGGNLVPVINPSGFLARLIRLIRWPSRWASSRWAHPSDRRLRQSIEC